MTRTRYHTDGQTCPDRYKTCLRWHTTWKPTHTPDGPAWAPQALWIDRFGYAQRGAPVEVVAEPPKPQGVWVTKDSGERQEYPSGMRRDLQEGKPRFDLIFPEGVAYEDQILTRFAGLLERGAAKYGDNNWQLANSEEELKRFRASGLRHMIQWACGETDEDHATAVIFNLMAYEHTKRKLEADD